MAYMPNTLLPILSNTATATLAVVLLTAGSWGTGLDKGLEHYLCLGSAAGFSGEVVVVGGEGGEGLSAGGLAGSEGMEEEIVRGVLTLGTLGNNFRLYGTIQQQPHFKFREKIIDIDIDCSFEDFLKKQLNSVDRFH
ncbi:hypothetical protein LXL04_014830 [Taraxacum kok-saghyz]